MTDFTWKIGGEAGYGIMTTGLVFSKIAARSGYHIFDYVKYPSLIRGGHNAYEVRVSSEPVSHLKLIVDVLVSLNKETFDKNRLFLTPNSFVVFDEEEFKIEGNYKKINVPLRKILNDLKGPLVMKNTIALGASLALLKADLNELLNIIEKEFTDKGQTVVDFNKKFAETGFDYVIKNYPSIIKPYLVKKQSPQKIVISGNDAFSLGAAIADCRLYASYPMTPSSSVLATLASWQEKSGMIVRHAEDEISVINTAIGASFAGVRSAVGTSGGGFALMVEAVSLAGITETPIVIFLASRPGPATGMPTWTEQGDFLFAVFSGHGEFPKIVLAPGDIEEMLELTGKAFNLADVYQTPVVIMSDMYLSESHKSVSLDFVNDFIRNYKIIQGKTVSSPSNKKYFRYQITEDGISERLIPGTKGYYYQANSYEHLEDSHTTEESLARKNQVDKRNKKSLTYLDNDFDLPKIYGDIEKAQTVFVSWGSTKGVVLQAQKLLLEKSDSSAFIHFNHLYPLDKEKITPLLTKEKRYVLVENNSWGQFGKLLAMETGIEIKEKILKYDGRPIWAEEIIRYLNVQPASPAGGHPTLNV